MWMLNLDNYVVFGVPLLVILLCGILGVLIDIDHPLSYYWLTKLKARFLHTPLLIAGCCILCVALACAGGLLLGMVLT